MRNIPTTLLLLLFCSLAAQAQEKQSPIKQVATVTYGPADEISGIVKSRTYPGVYWVHNDSGDKPRLFPLTATGKLIFPRWLRGKYHGESAEAGKKLWPGVKIRLAANNDWEDIALADGKLYVADMGNNGNARRDLGIYLLNEPNPRAIESARILAYWPVRYPEQKRYPAVKWHFDCESIFIFEGKPYLLTKHRAAGKIGRPQIGTKLYRLDTRFTDKQNVLTLVDSHPTISLWPTGADLSPNGKQLAVITQTEIWVFARPAKGDKWLSGKAVRLKLPWLRRTRQAEAICWKDNQTLRFANEQRAIFEVSLAAFEPAPAKGN